MEKSMAIPKSEAVIPTKIPSVFHVEVTLFQRGIHVLFS